MAILARSLADITALASAPSARPASSHEFTPLTLYIARVPGSRDVFLTTLKPRDHVVNAQDVQGSLFFLHVNDDLDDELIKGVVKGIETKEPQHSIGRKPLPTPPASLTIDPPPADFSTKPSIQRKPIESRHSDIQSHSENFNPSQGNLSLSTSRNTRLTLIRRDACTNTQWNVANIVVPSAKSDKQSADIEVTNSGYEQFSNKGISTAARPDGVVFSRQLNTQLYLTGEAHRHSHYRAPRVHTFQSPWDSKCELSTGHTGRSFKCKHHKQSIAGINSSTISELRLDLPALGKRSRTVDEPQDHSGSSRMRGPDPLTAIKDWSQNALVPELEYSLGREAAGGGILGRRAKLGKLIVSGEGLEMLDLTVAANMAVWWRAYERTPTW